MNGLAQNNRYQLLPRSTIAESLVTTPEFQFQLLTVLPETITAAVTVLTASAHVQTEQPPSEEGEQTPRIEDPDLDKLKDLGPMLNDVYRVFLVGIPIKGGADTLRIDTIIKALNSAIEALKNSKTEINNLIGQPNSSNPLTNLQNLESLLIRKLLTVFRKINDIKIGSINKPRTIYFEQLQRALKLLGVNSSMTEDELTALANLDHDVLEEGPTRLGQLFAQIRACINPEAKT